MESSIALGKETSINPGLLRLWLKRMMIMPYRIDITMEGKLDAYKAAKLCYIMQVYLVKRKIKAQDFENFILKAALFPYSTMIDYLAEEGSYLK